MKKKINIYQLTTAGIFAALMCIFGPLSVPIGPVPVSLTNLILYFAIYLIGTKGTLTSYCVYLLLGIVGLPIFSNFEGGIAKVVGPTGGYLLGFIPMVIIIGVVHKLTKKNNILNIVCTILAMIAGTAVAYVLGTIWFLYVTKASLTYALTVCVYPFIPFDLIKMVIATILGKAVYTALKRGNLV